jgi:tetratricopeptide (TPR) repeat protein
MVWPMSSERAAQLISILAQQPENAFAHYALGMEHASSGETDAALGEFRRALELDARNANAFLMGAQALERAERIPEAIQWLREGVECAQKVGNRHAESEMQALLEALEH